MFRHALAALLLAALFVVGQTGGAAPRGFVLADFESGQVTLESYDLAQDRDPSSWELSSSNTHESSRYALRLYGNSWKAQPISPYTIQQGTVFSVATFVEEIGEMQAFGISDGMNTLFYTFAGSELPTSDPWVVSYQGAFPDESWNVYMLPVGRDWYERYGYQPTLNRLVYVNDRDATNRGVTIFDDVMDVTLDLPVAPTVEIVCGQQRVSRLSARLFRVGVQFHGQVNDPDSDTFTYSWDFGDSTGSVLESPYHEFLVASNHTYTVSLAVQDESGMWGRDSTQVRVDPGEAEPLIRMNFVGDVMLARGYDQPGGIIDQHGPEWIFMPTRPVYGDAADINVCNLECPLTDEGTPHPTKSIVFRGRPTNVAGLTYAGIDVVSIANNHIIDYGRRGMEETQEVLETARIRWGGAGENDYVALQPTFWSERGVAVGFIGMCNRTGREYNYQPFLDAAYNKPGFAYLLEPNLDDGIAAVRPLADLLVLQLHAGVEYETDPGTFVPPGIEPAYDAEGPVPGTPEFRFPTRPTLTDRQLRWRAVDDGADLVICHHPHVLQGFEVYHGVLIAHSLGNFAFDQSYAETFPSVILYSEFDKDRFWSFTFRPIFIDSWIPRPATGELGRDILEKMADYSRELNTVVSIDPDASVGTIHLSPGTVQWLPTFFEMTVPLAEENSSWVSLPIEREGPGTLSRILSIEGSGSVEVRIGRELLWHGGFEDEGASFWNLNSADEVYDPSIAYDGIRSLRQHRTPINSGQVQTDLKGYPPTLGGTEFSVCGYLRTENAQDAGFSARVFNGRGGQALASYEAGPLVTGTHGWVFLWANFQTTDQTHYFNIRCHGDRPVAGDGYAWFDDLRMIEWEPWQAAALPMSVPYPSNLRFIQVRLSNPADSVQVRWEDVRANSVPAEIVGDPGSIHIGPRLEPGSPNPFRERASIAYFIPRAGRVRVEVFDVTGRRVALLEDGARPAGRHHITWQAEGVSSGLYLSRLSACGEVRTGKLLLLK